MLLNVPIDRDLDKIFCEPGIVSEYGSLEGCSLFSDPFTSWEETFQGIFRFYFRHVCLRVITQFPVRIFSLRHHQRKIPSLATQMFFLLSTLEMNQLKQYCLPSS